MAAADNPAETNWRTGKDFRQRFAYMLKTGDGADVHFLVGKPGDDEERELIVAHKTILFSSSSVFGTQFSFGNAIHTQEGSEEKPIEVSDVRPNAFRAMLKFVYSDDFSGVTKQNVMDVFYAAKKYMLDNLLKQCRLSLFIGKNLDAVNALSVLKHAQQHEDKELINHCWLFVDSYATAVLKSNEFLFLNQHDVCELFSRDTLVIDDEHFLFQSLQRWAIHQLESTELENTADNLRDISGLAIYQIRFPLFTAEEFTQTIVPTGLLTEKDIIALYVHFNGKQNSIDAKRQFPNRFNRQQRCVSKTKLIWSNNKWQISDQDQVQANADGLNILNTDNSSINVRANQHVSRAMLVLIPGQKLVYWEVEMKKGRASEIGWIGPNFPLNEKYDIGEHPGSFAIDCGGIYSEFGRIFYSYGKGFDEEDVVGSGLLLTRDNRLKIFYTKNGALMGMPFVLTEDSQDLLLCPAVGLRWKNTTVEANFGADPAGKPLKFKVNAHKKELFG